MVAWPNPPTREPPSEPSGQLPEGLGRHAEATAKSSPGGDPRARLHVLVVTARP